MKPVRLKRSVRVSLRGKSVWTLIVSVWKKRLLLKNKLLIFVLDDLLRLCACAEVPDGLCAEEPSNAEIYSVATCR